MGSRGLGLCSSGEMLLPDDMKSGESIRGRLSRLRDEHGEFTRNL